MSFKVSPSILMILFYALVSAQEPSDIYVFDLIENDSIILLNNPLNVSANEGYDNQPSFSEDGSILFFASEREGQIDLLFYSFSILKNHCKIIRILRSVLHSYQFTFLFEKIH